MAPARETRDKCEKRKSDAHASLLQKSPSHAAEEILSRFLCANSAGNIRESTSGSEPTIPKENTSKFFHKLPLTVAKLAEELPVRGARRSSV